MKADMVRADDSVSYREAVHKRMASQPHQKEKCKIYSSLLRVEKPVRTGQCRLKGCKM